MEKTPKEMLKAYVDSQKYHSATQIMDAMKEMFRDVLQHMIRTSSHCSFAHPSPPVSRPGPFHLP